MSYILDALRRSERERTPGAVNARDPGPAPLPPRTIVLYAVPIGALIVVAIGIYLIVGRLLGPDAGAPAVVAQANPVASTRAAKEAPATPAREKTAKAEPAPATPAARSDESHRAPPATKPGPFAPPARVRNLAEQTRVAPPVTAPPSEPPLPGTVISVSPPPSPVARPAPDPVRLLRAMPPDFQRALPELVVNIHVYASNAAERILYINNREYHAGDKVRDDIVVEQIVEDGAVLSFRGQRFKLPRPS